MTEMTAEHVLNCTLAIWVIRRTIEYRKKLGMVDLDLSKPFSIPLPKGIDGGKLKDGDCYYLIANCDQEGLLDLPDDDDTSFASLKVGTEIVKVGKRQFFDQKDCHYLYAVACQAYDGMFDKNYISQDTYDVGLAGLIKLVRNQQENISNRAVALVRKMAGRHPDAGMNLDDYNEARAIAAKLPPKPRLSK